MKIPIEVIAILVIINSIGILPIIGFFAWLWYNSKRHAEIINSLVISEHSLKERVEKLEKDLEKKINELEKARIEENSRFSNTITEMSTTLKHLDNTLNQTLNQTLKMLIEKVDKLKA